ncbi:hypothetical protein LINPERHAP1_LOCUS7587, partial [Linum perenne]
MPLLRRKGKLKKKKAEAIRGRMVFSDVCLLLPSHCLGVLFYREEKREFCYFLFYFIIVIIILIFCNFCLR